jgi:hypothetical protein
MTLKSVLIFILLNMVVFITLSRYVNKKYESAYILVYRSKINTRLAEIQKICLDYMYLKIYLNNKSDIDEIQNYMDAKQYSITKFFKYYFYSGPKLTKLKNNAEQIIYKIEALDDSIPILNATNAARMQLFRIYNLIEEMYD